MTNKAKIGIIIDDETRPVWECAKRSAAEVATWPSWKRGEQACRVAVTPSMTLTLTPKQMAKIIADSARAALVQIPTVDKIDAAATAIGNNAVQAVLAFTLEES